MSQKITVRFNEIGQKDIQQVGGKNAALGEMIRHLGEKGVKIPPGFATTAYAYREFLKQKGLDQQIYALLKNLPIENVTALHQAGAKIRNWITHTPFLPEFETEVLQAFRTLKGHEKKVSFAVRSSATAEDLPTASFAGQQETYLNVHTEEELLIAIKKVYVSLFTDRAIVYRVQHKFKHETVALSVGVERMVRSDLGVSGVMFSLDTESGFRDVVFINAAHGLGEMIVQGQVNPDEYIVYKPSLAQNRLAILRKKLGDKLAKMVYAKSTMRRAGAEEAVKIQKTTGKERQHFALLDSEIQELARYAELIDQHYQCPMDIEWAKDGLDGQLYILQARPETVKSQIKTQVLELYELKEKGKILIEGRSVGQRIGRGKARILQTVSQMSKMQPGDILVTDMTDPDWEPIMKIASAIVTNRGGRTCHAAIVARELGIPAVVGTGKATEVLVDGHDITVSCAEGDEGYVYEGLLNYEIKKLDVGTLPPLPVKITMNVADPDQVFNLRFLPNFGVGLARLEFIIQRMIGIHPNALIHFDEQTASLKREILKRTSCYENPVDFYVSKLREGVATIAAAFYPHPVIVRTSDFKSNEYANLLGGQAYEPSEENPMIGFRGASRYVDPSFRECFKLECRALKQIRDDMGLTNVEIMIPFVRTVAEGKSVIDLMAEYGLKRGENGLRVIMMCEVPSTAIIAEEFLEHCDGFSIGSNDLTQLTLGLDRDSSIVAHLFEERDHAVKFLISRAIQTCNRLGKYIGICGQAPSDYPDFAEWLVKEGIGSISLNPDTVVKTWMYLGKKVVAASGSLRL